jgi:hypothetical protein
MAKRNTNTLWTGLMLSGYSEIASLHRIGQHRHTRAAESSAAARRRDRHLRLFEQCWRQGRAVSLVGMFDLAENRDN